MKNMQDLKKIDERWAYSREEMISKYMTEKHCN